MTRVVAAEERGESPTRRISLVRDKIFSNPKRPLMLVKLFKVEAGVFGAFHYLPEPSTCSPGRARAYALTVQQAVKICMSCERILVHRSIAAAFGTALSSSVTKA
jgi:hypothetical protein